MVCHTIMSFDGLGTTPTAGDEAAAAPKSLSRRGVKTGLAVISGLVLAVGAWLTPRVAPTPLSAPRELAAPLLEEQVQLRAASRPFMGVQDVAARVREHGVAIHPAAAEAVATSNHFASPTRPPQAPTFGVVVSDTFALTHIAALDGRSSVQLSTAGARVADARVEARVLLPAAILDRAGIPATAHVLSINGRAGSSTPQARRELHAGRNPVPVLLRDGDHVFFAALEPAR